MVSESKQKRVAYRQQVVRRLPLALLCAAALSFTLFLFTPMDIYAGNRTEFLFSFTDMGGWLLALALVGTMLFGALIALTPRRVSAVIAAVVFWLGVMGDVQGMFLNIGLKSLLGDGGYPYGLPIDYWYNEADGKLYFHGAKEGHKIDAIRACDKASFCIYDEGVRMDGEWPLHFRSVIVFGRIAPVTDEAATALACKELSRKFTPDDEYFNKEYAAAKDRVLCLALTPEHITGKRIKEN